MLRRSCVALVAGFGMSSLVVSPALAGGGGGCYGPATDGSGVTVAIRNFCFTPTVLHVQPGDRITFVNRDSSPHTVTGANGVWGTFDELDRGDAVAYAFGEPGTYSYFCAYHIGMVGTVVVGNGSGAGPAKRIGVIVEPVAVPTSAPIVSPAAPEEPAVEIEAAAAGSEPSGGGSSLGWLVGGVAGLILGAGASLLARRRARVRTEGG
ncbi:MAG: cupredoxin domain-containing protein [Actinomycetota bacterium]